MLNEVITSVKSYNSSQDLSIGEQAVGTRFRFSFIQYMPKKTTKFGL